MQDNSWIIVPATTKVKITQSVTKAVISQNEIKAQRKRDGLDGLISHFT